MFRALFDVVFSTIWIFTTESMKGTSTQTIIDSHGRYGRVAAGWGKKLREMKNVSMLLKCGKKQNVVYSDYVRRRVYEFISSLSAICDLNVTHVGVTGGWMDAWSVAANQTQCHIETQ